MDNNFNNKKYQDLYNKYKLMYTNNIVNGIENKTLAKIQLEVNQLWKDKIKKGAKEDVNIEVFEFEMMKLNSVLEKKKKGGIDSFFGKKSRVKTSINNNMNVPPMETEAVFAHRDNREEAPDKKTDDEQAESFEVKEIHLPAQERIIKEIGVKEKLLKSLIESRNLGILDEESAATISKRIKIVSEEKVKLERELKRKRTVQKATSKYRKLEKERKLTIMRDFPEIAASVNINVHNQPGRPSLDIDQPEMMNDILNIATIGAACSDKRREDLFRSIKTLDDLHEELQKMGYKISRSGTYLRLLPRDASTTEGRRHHNTVPVRLVRPDNNLRKKHPDRIFAKEGFKMGDDIAAFIGPEAALYLSQDDKSSVPLGVTAAKKQSSILMSLRYRVRLPDHDFKVGSKHLLTPSVICICNIDPKTGVSYSGPSFVGIRSAKHNGSSAYTHHEDLQRFAEIEKESFLMKGSEIEYKPVVIKGVDGGPDENPRFEKNINMACKTFQDFQLDMLMEVTNAPGLSAYNRAERKMFPLSKALTGVVLPYDTFGSHLDGQGKTVDTDLEEKNFKAAGGVLAEIWDGMKVDGYRITAKYIDEPAGDETREFNATNLFKSKHVLETQYFTVILKCDDRSCCPPFKTKVNIFFPNRRIPALIPFKYSKSGPVALQLEKDVFKENIEFHDIFGRIVVEDKLAPPYLVEKYGDRIPFDVYFPSVQEKVEKRTCPDCKQYHSSLKSLNGHKRALHAKKRGGKRKGKNDVVGNRAISDFIDDDNEKETDQEQERDDLVDSQLEAMIANEIEDEFDEFVEDMAEEPGVSVTVPFTSTLVKIIDLKEWIKSPWTSD